MDIKRNDLEILHQTAEDLVSDSLKSTYNMFKSNYGFASYDYQDILQKKILLKLNDEYSDCLQIDKMQDNEETKKDVEQLTVQLTQKSEQIQKQQMDEPQKVIVSETPIGKALQSIAQEQQPSEKLSKIPKQFLLLNKAKPKVTDEPQENLCRQLLPVVQQKEQEALWQLQPTGTAASRIGAIMVKKLKKIVKPEWHAPWKLMRVIIGHQGWVRCIDVDKTNEWFVTSGNDRMIKFWDLASGKLKLTLTGHVSTVRKVAIAKNLMYLFSCAEDKTIKCWDLEYNKIVRNYHGHLSGVYSLAVHPTLNLIASGGRDATVRLWDIRTRAQVHVLAGHEHAVSSLVAQEFEPQLISGGHDNMIKLWDIGMGKAITTLTNHKKGVRDMMVHPTEYTWVSGAADNLKVWKCPEGEFLRNVSGHNCIVNCLALNRDNVLMCGGDNGSLHFWDWKSGYKFQQIQSQVQPGSISAEGGIFCSKFDQSSLRLLTGECDKTIKVWKEDETATPETHPVADISMEFDQHKY